MADVSLGDFHSLVADALGRSVSLDTVIPLRVKMAVQWLERNYTFQYMKAWQVLEVSASAEFPHIISLAGLRVKSVDLLRRRRVDDNTGTYLFDRPLLKVNPQDRESRPSGSPESFWVNGRSSLVFNSIPDEDMTFESNITQFTSWGSGTDWTHWLLDNATNLLLSRTLQMMCSRTRDPDMYAMYKSEVDLELQSFNVSEEDIQTGDNVMVWEPPEHVQDESLRSA